MLLTPPNVQTILLIMTYYLYRVMQTLETDRRVLVQETRVDIRTIPPLDRNEKCSVLGCFALCSKHSQVRMLTEDKTMLSSVYVVSLCAECDTNWNVPCTLERGTSIINIDTLNHPVGEEIRRRRRTKCIIL